MANKAHALVSWYPSVDYTRSRAERLSSLESWRRRQISPFYSIVHRSLRCEPSSSSPCHLHRRPLSLPRRRARLNPHCRPAHAHCASHLRVGSAICRRRSVSRPARLIGQTDREPTRSRRSARMGSGPEPVQGQSHGKGGLSRGLFQAKESFLHPRGLRCLSGNINMCHCSGDLSQVLPLNREKKI